MAVPPVVIKPGTNSVVAAAGVPVVAIPANISGGFITNPQDTEDQGVPAEPLYVNPISPPGLQANGTTFALAPGATWTVVPGQTTVTAVNAKTAGHKFSVIWW